MNQALPAKTISLGSKESPIDNARLLDLCGQRHSNIQIIEQELMIKCYQQGSDFVSVSYTHLTLPTICSV